MKQSIEKFVEKNKTVVYKRVFKSSPCLMYAYVTKNGEVIYPHSIIEVKDGEYQYTVSKQDDCMVGGIVKVGDGVSVYDDPITKENLLYTGIVKKVNIVNSMHWEGKLFSENYCTIYSNGEKNDAWVTEEVNEFE